MGAGKRAVRSVLAALLLAGAASAVGCGGTIYAVNASSAQARLDQARALGAEKYAPYEYW